MPGLLCAVSSGRSVRFASPAQAETGEAEAEQRERAGLGHLGAASATVRSFRKNLNRASGTLHLPGDSDARATST